MWVRNDDALAPRFGQHLEAARRRASFSRPELAARLGVSEESVRRWERGWSAPPADRMAQLIAVLAIDANLLVSLPIHGDDLPPLARTLRDERAQRHITQAEAAGLIGVSQPTYAGWEIGRATPSERYFPMVANFLGVDGEQFSVLVETPFVVNTASWPPLGRVLGARRQALRLTRDELARLMKVAPTTVAAWELGYRTPLAQQIYRLSVLLDVEVSVLQDVLPRREQTALGELIRSRQQHLGLPRRAIAERAGLDEATLSRWVQGHNTPKESNLRRLARALEISFDELSQAVGIVSP